MYGDTADEILRAIDRAEIAFPPALGAFTVYFVESAWGQRHTTLYLTRRVLIRLFVSLTVTGGNIEDVLSAAVNDEEKQLLCLVNFDERAGVGPGNRAEIHVRKRCSRLIVDLAVGIVEAHVFLKGHDGLTCCEAILTVNRLDPETQFQEAALHACCFAAAASADGRERWIQHGDFDDVDRQGCRGRGRNSGGGRHRCRWCHGGGGRHRCRRCDGRGQRGRLGGGCRIAA